MSLLGRVQAASFQQYRAAAAAPAPAPGPTSDFWFTPEGFLVDGRRLVGNAALTISALWQGTRLIGEGIAGMPCQLFEREGEDGRRRLRDNPLAYRLRWQPNRWQTSFDFWQPVAIATLLRGIFLAKLHPGPDTGYADEIEPIHPDLVRPKRLPNGDVVYQITGQPGREPEVLEADEVFVVRGRTDWDGVTPMSVVQWGARSMQAAMAAEDFASQFFKTGASPALAVIEKDGELGEDGIKNLHHSVMAYVSGLKNAFSVLPLEGNVDVKQLGVSPEDAQLILTRQFGVEEIARWLNVPLHMLRFSQQGTGSYASLEVFSAEFVTYTLRPIAVAIEQSIHRDLFRQRDRERIFAEFNMDALLRGDLKSRYEAYRIGIMSGFLRRNEARIKENLSPADGLDEFWTPMNVGANVVDREGSGAQAKLLEFRRATVAGREGYRMVVLAQEAAGRLLRRERAGVEALARRHAKDPDGWQTGLQTFYADHATLIAETLRIPADVARTYAAKQGMALQKAGVGAMDGFDHTAMEDLALMALTGGESIAA